MGHPELNHPETLHFKVSSGLKRVLGRELITNDEVALFELVKNSFDANANNVYIYFNDKHIIVADDGDGMTYDDIKDKWLFVAYSAKRDENIPTDYRDNVGVNQYYAGSKGIGRFSSDRLGKKLQLQTRSKNDINSFVNYLNIDWSGFEKNDLNPFDKVNVEFSSSQNFSLPREIPLFTNGTVIIVSEIEKKWERSDIIKLRSGLAKLINPFGNSVDGFKITIIAPDEIGNDLAAQAKYDALPEDKKSDHPDLANGPLDNFIFSSLKTRTTFINIEIIDSGENIKTKLTDRGVDIFSTKEKNPFPLLKTSHLKCDLYYLNKAAKMTFARRMGLASVKFGSVFLFKNNFRVFPIGEDGDDWFSIDRRKQQGYARFLGTREIIGKIDISGHNELFQEASSRNQGLIENEATHQLKNFFIDYCLKRLEKYVVPVNWGLKGDAEVETTSLIESDGGRNKISEVIANLIGSNEVEILSYNSNLVGILNERSGEFESSLVSLRVIAEKTQDKNLFDKIEYAEQRFAELKKSENEAKKIADEERIAKESALSRAENAEAEAASIRVDLHEEKKRNLFLASVSSLDVDSILDLHHLITIYAADLQQQIENMILGIGNKTNVSKDYIIDSLEPISFLNKRVLSISQFATKANFRIDSEFIEYDLPTYITSYINEIAKNFSGARISIDSSSASKGFVKKFKPIDISILIGNLISNARRANASKITFDIYENKKNLLEISVNDNGKDFTARALEENNLFNKGFTTTSGSGLGLYHIKQVISAMDGSIEPISVTGTGLRSKFLIRISK